MEGLRVLIIFAVMIVLLQKKVNTGIVMILGALFLVFFI